jgi:predicted AAA+ superfamily ATPase
MPYYGRWLERDLGRRTSRGKVRLLFGARQTGKSSLLRTLLPEDAVHIDLQDGRARVRYERTPGVLADELEVRREKRLVVCIDEIQKVPSLLDDVQHLHDRQAGRFDFFVTGSSARRLRAGAANLLPGRAHVYRLFPVTGVERVGYAGSSVLPRLAPVGDRAGFPRRSLEDLLVWGSLPGITLEPAVRRGATLTAYSEVYLEEEIRREAVVRDLGAFSRFLTLAALESGQIMNLTGLSQESGVPVATIRNFYQVLVDTFVGYWVPPYGRAGRKEILSTPRFVFFDTGVRNAAAELPLSRDLLKTQAGPLFEQWVLAELIHRTSYLGRTHGVSFWRTRHGAEVDAVVETPKEDIPIEVKWTDNPRPTDARHLETFIESFAPRTKRGYVVCRVPQARRLSERVTAIPWDEL